MLGRKCMPDKMTVLKIVIQEWAWTVELTQMLMDGQTDEKAGVFITSVYSAAGATKHSYIKHIKHKQLRMSDLYDNITVPAEVTPWCVHELYFERKTCVTTHILLASFRGAWLSSTHLQTHWIVVDVIVASSNEIVRLA